eukprot:TRINITY_DN43319_c0_g3_i1.p1 TRINITY_DN43319_c0_g3~~TRINITY_DN43319_c0_g3_i1.p1  ORF type:complete len:677 (-),score=157.50 TRINITY_DN43319_c0_g3_i1:76-2106(-)
MPVFGIKSFSQRGTIVASFTMGKTEVNGTVIGLTNLDTRFFDEEGLEEFLRNPGISTGILQRFLYPNALRNCEFLVHWTPHVLQCEKRTNRSHLNELMVPPTDRAATFGAVSHLFDQAPVTNGLILNRIKGFCSLIRRHLERVTPLAPRKMSIVCKFSTDGKLYLLYIPEILTDKATTSHINLAKEFLRPRLSAIDSVSVALDHEQEFHDLMVPSPSSSAPLPAPLDVRCQECGMLIPRKHQKFHVSYETVIRLHDINRRTEAVNDEEEAKPRSGPRTSLVITKPEDEVERESAGKRDGSRSGERGDGDANGGEHDVSLALEGIGDGESPKKSPRSPTARRESIQHDSAIVSARRGSVADTQYEEAERKRRRMSISRIADESTPRPGGADGSGTGRPGIMFRQKTEALMNRQHGLLGDPFKERGASGEKKSLEMIPPLLLENDPEVQEVDSRLSWKLLRRNRAFLDRRLLLCDLCALKFSDFEMAQMHLDAITVLSPGSIHHGRVMRKFLRPAPTVSPVHSRSPFSRPQSSTGRMQRPTSSQGGRMEKRESIQRPQTAVGRRRPLSTTTPSPTSTASERRKMARSEPHARSRKAWTKDAGDRDHIERRLVYSPDGKETSSSTTPHRRRGGRRKVPSSQTGTGNDDLKEGTKRRKLKKKKRIKRKSGPEASEKTTSE